MSHPGMDESRRQARIQAGQRWVQAAVEAILARAAIPLGGRGAGQPALTWEPQPGAQGTLSLWLRTEATPRYLSCAVNLIEDCGAGRQSRHAYARAYIVRSLRQMGIL